MSRPVKMPGKQTQTAFRLPDELIERIDAHARRMAETMPGVTFTRADAVRALLTIALDQVEPKRRRS